MSKSKEKSALAIENSAVTVLPSPKLNLHDLEAVRREMARVYRDMRGGAIDTQDGTRLVYVLGEMRKLFEIIELERRIHALEEKR
ncbi:hypothetical protein C8R21_10651 [Nitrosospira multiformis]|uniref:Uncharacterized protein n=1 Tax=Nitrosospira multiformis TaxID=1231 RepID=A0A2T5IE14_9PROT|nr:hypothetical protein [Nitrosospira multiformis]PTQ82072.1 hypothetical protein C8R21_10651 [Nitrosospira multiformis]